MRGTSIIHFILYAHFYGQYDLEIKYLSYFSILYIMSYYEELYYTSEGECINDYTNFSSIPNKGDPPEAPGLYVNGVLVTEAELMAQIVKTKNI